MTDTRHPSTTIARAQDGTAPACQRTGDGYPLVLLAGQANNHHWWDAVRADFHATHSTITLDHRGTGESDKPQGPYSTRQFADDVIAVLDHLGVERADVHGTSMGGRVAGGTPSGGGWPPATPAGCDTSSWAAPPPAVRTPSSGTPPYDGPWPKPTRKPPAAH